MRTSGFFLLLLLCGVLQAQVTPTMRMQLFNGQDLSGWAHVGKGKFVIEQSMLKTEGGPGVLWHPDRLIGNAILRIVYKTNGKTTNSGVFIRMPERLSDVKQAGKGYEVEINDAGDDYHTTGTLFSFTKAQARFSKPNQWNTLEITLDGAKTIVTINGVKVTEFTEGDTVPAKKDNDPERMMRPTEGYIGLQNNSDNDIVYFREISIRPIDKKSQNTGKQ